MIFLYLGIQKNTIYIYQGTMHNKLKYIGHDLLEKSSPKREKNLKNPKSSSNMKVTTIRESNDLSNISTFELFSNLKAHE